MYLLEEEANPKTQRVW